MVLRKTVVFDLDGTLVETAGDLTHALNHVLEGEGLPKVTTAGARPKVSYGGVALIAFGYASAGRPAPEGDDMKRLFDRFVARYESNIAVESRPFPGAVEALDRLAEDGWTLAVCTNKRENLARRLLGELGLDLRFAAICGADTFAFKKPDPRHLLLTVELAKGDPRRCVMVGDAAPDTEAAKAAGIPVIGIGFGYSSVPMEQLAPDAVISHYDALVETVNGLVMVHIGDHIGDPVDGPR